MWAAVSCSGGLLPLPGLDAALDSLLMPHWLRAIERDFGLAPGESGRIVAVRQSWSQKRLLRIAASMLSSLLPRRLLTAALGREGMRRSLRYLPMAGQAAASALAFAVTLRAAYAHIDACHAAALARSEDFQDGKEPAWLCAECTRGDIDVRPRYSRPAGGRFPAGRDILHLADNLPRANQRQAVERRGGKNRLQ